MRISDLQLFNEDKSFVVAEKEGSTWVLPSMSAKNLKDIQVLCVFQESFNKTNNENFTWVDGNILNVNHQLNTVNIISVDINNEIINDDESKTVNKYSDIGFVVYDENNIQFAFPLSSLDVESGTWNVKIIALNN